MAGNFHPDWGSWAATQKSSSDWTADSLAASGEETSDAISLDTLGGIEISVKVVYNGSATDPVTVYVLRDTDGTNYETSSDSPWGFNMPFSAGGTHYKTFTVYGDEVSSFKVSVLNNDSSYAATMTVKQRTWDGAYT